MRHYHIGGTGLIGNSWVDRLLADGCNVGGHQLLRVGTARAVWRSMGPMDEEPFYGRAHRPPTESVCVASVEDGWWVEHG